MFFLVEASSPWTIEVPDGGALAPAILPRAQHVISYHVVTRGSCWGGLRAGAPVRLEAGDVLVFPRGDPYVMSIARGMQGAPDVSEILLFHFVGQPPMQYLTRWRMQLAARLLADGEAKVSAIAPEVGYDSEAAFSRAFKKVAGVAPATWRRRHAFRPVPLVDRHLSSALPRTDRSSRSAARRRAD